MSSVGQVLTFVKDRSGAGEFNPTPVTLWRIGSFPTSAPHAFG